MSRLSTVGFKLSLALFALILGALAIVYVAVVPSLEDRLIDGRLDQLERTARLVVRDIVTSEDGPFTLHEVLVAESEDRGVRVVVYDRLDENPVFLRVFDDSRGVGQSLPPGPVAQAAAERQRLERGVVERQGRTFAEVAVPYGGINVALVSTPLEDTLGAISLVERRLVLAGLLALLAAAAVGLALARLFARRIRRLEQAAERIAGGRFEEPVVDRSADELGELARAFDRMRIRLSALERARREFIANASHELRTPIFALGGHLELLTDEDVDEPTRREFMEEMRLQVVRLTKLATDLLDLSRLDAGRLRVELAPVDLGEIAGSLVGEFGGVGSEHLLVADGEDGAFAVADEERVRQIGRILLENAIVHTPPGTRVRLAAGSDAKTAALSVEDNGPGIAPEDREHVFERFYRADGARTSGSGLGLAIARELAEVMGGEIELATSPGRTVFTLTLPRMHVPSAEPEPALAR
jgi:two-component system, OmpR family, sensor kinase